MGEQLYSRTLHYYLVVDNQHHTLLVWWWQLFSVEFADTSNEYHNFAIALICHNKNNRCNNNDYNIEIIMRRNYYTL